MFINEKLKDKLKDICGFNVKFDEPLKEYTTFKIGGPADILVIPNSIKELKEVLITIQDIDIPFFILGKGSNVIVGDRGFRGIVINTEKLNHIKVEGKEIISETGILLADVSDKALEVGLTGLEFASGIPGSLGGAIYMNAGAYGGMIEDVITEVRCLSYQGEELTLSKEELKLSYRHSILQDEPLIAVEARISLDYGNKKEIKAKIDDLTDKRWTKQPMEMPSAGSIFKRPENYYASALIDEAGLKGTRVGEAEVSKKHAGFIVNLGNASAEDVKNLIKLVQDEIYQKNGVKLEVEPRFIGEFIK
ncbi:UDP-N-acetylmuramate dehydrogenase [Orenia metallireducens]|uniref:UDP-N-acetylenolpyruvoylglucosamine reductase n=1 Tax=Orenia metallireducens TaxID=1413210 RepID=A0A285H274_9FIRM|nr:UDP-N-acetylmuramate dehydrogenase [Orenia metallireducens]PRX29431.1 UDP-N-acetylmuramate dehydrogenase [Orenia metallireducens]SNY29788.1 UDP-N-acetylmuramate dehydrogenase [Orenia metallireducens]